MADQASEFRVRVVGVNSGIGPDGAKTRQYILGLFDAEGNQLVHQEDGVEIPIVFAAYTIAIASSIVTPNKSNIILH